MGVPKFFRWLSERYPKINQRYGSPPNPETAKRYFDQPSDLDALEPPDPLSTCGLPPEIDRLYIDMNGIIHGCSHNNSDQSTESGDVQGQEEPVDRNARGGTFRIANDEIFRNVCYYLDRVIGDMVQPKKVVYMAIDGVAPRAKMNQQRSRRYRSGREGEIETNIYEAHAQAMEEDLLRRREEEEEAPFGEELYEEDDSYKFVLDVDEGNRTSALSSSDTDDGPTNLRGCSSENGRRSTTSHTDLQEISPGRFKGKFETHVEEGANSVGFHSSAITPGTPFFSEFTKHLEHFVKYKLSTDPKWKDLTIIFSGPNVPGEGEHKIMQFIREQRGRPDYDPNLRHCIMGQDGDLIMLGLCTHEPNLVLFRERVIYNITQQRLEEAKVADLLSRYIHNAHFEFLHMGVLRDYLAYEFETSNVISDSPWDLERTIDDFVLMSFLCGNDFLPHLPAIDIGDNAFDLLFGKYKNMRQKWQKQNLSDDPIKNQPYLTYAGNIVSGKQLEEYLSALGSHEVAYYDKKKQSSKLENKRLRKQYKWLGMDKSILPDNSLVASKEASDRAAYRKMLQNMGDSMDSSDPTGDMTSNNDDADKFRPVMSGKVKFEPVADDIEEGLISRMGTLLRNSLSTSSNEKDEGKYQLASIDDQDLKGRYYYDKFQFTPFDADKHLSLRRAYIEGLVWNLKYYYEGCVSWEWYFPYHYGPMLSDLVNLDEILAAINFDDQGAPLNPFEQLLGCMPPSQARHLPKPYRWLMIDPQSPIIDFYPTTLTIDMNGKRWPWEAVVLLPFVDSKRLTEATSKIDNSLLSKDERGRNAVGTTVVMMHDPAHEEVVPQIGNLECFQRMDSCSAISVPFENSDWNYASDNVAVLEPTILEGTEHPLPGFSSLRTAPVQSLWRRKMGLNIFGGRSRYKTATLEISSLMPHLPPEELLGPKLIGTSVFVNYPHYVEALVTAVSNERITIRGKSDPRKWSQGEASRWKLKRDGIIRNAEIGEGQTGTGGLVLPSDQTLTLCVRPLQGLVTTKGGTVLKAYAKFEIEVPLISTFWSPAKPDMRLVNVPSRLEKNAFEVAMADVTQERSDRKSNSSKRKKGISRRKLFPAKQRIHKYSSQRSQGDTNGREKVSAAYYSTLHSRPLSIELGGRLLCDARPRSLFPYSQPSLGKVGPRYHSTFEIQTFNAQQSHSGQLRQPTNPIDNCRHTNATVITSNRRCLSPVITKNYAPKGRLLAASVVAASFLFNAAQAAGGLIFHRRSSTLRSKQMHHFSPNRDGLLKPWIDVRGGDFEKSSIDGVVLPPQRPTPPLEFAHGTTTLSFSFQGGIIVAVDSRASLGSFVGSKTVQKVLPINSHVLGTMAGGAADCQYWIRRVKSEALLHELMEDGKRMSVARVSRILSNCLYQCRGLQLSVGTMIAGCDAKGPQIYYVDNTGLRIQGDIFAVGSGSTFALGILDTQERRHELSVDDAIALGIKAIRHATFRDAYSGGFINVYLITPYDGWKKVYTEDIARSPEVWKRLNDDDEDNDNASQLIYR